MSISSLSTTALTLPALATKAPTTLKQGSTAEEAKETPGQERAETKTGGVDIKA